MAREHFSARVFDCHQLLGTPSVAASGSSHSVLTDIKREFERYGAVHCINTGLPTVGASADLALPEPLLRTLGFEAHQHFNLGGQTSENWQKKVVVPGFRRMDFYPPDRYLLPNQVPLLETHLFCLFAPGSDAMRHRTSFVTLWFFRGLSQFHNNTRAQPPRIYSIYLPSGGTVHASVARATHVFL